VPLSGGVGSFLHHTSKEGKRSLQTLAARPVMRYARGMAETIFLKIIAGEIPCHKIYEDDQVFAFLDIGPMSSGHTLLIPKEPAETLDQLSDESAAALGRVLPRLSRAVLKASGATAFNILQNNGASAHQAVMHVHFHIIPRFPEAAEGSGLGIEWPAGTLENEAGQRLAADIAAALDEE
jgi:histidine triad (HIT) family protein